MTGKRIGERFTKYPKSSTIEIILHSVNRMHMGRVEGPEKSFHPEVH